jgi:hypothetical protein
MLQMLMHARHEDHGAVPTGRRRRSHRFVAIAAACAMGTIALAADEPAPAVNTDPSSLERTRLQISEWITIQQTIAKERNDWQQGKEILVGRVELLNSEIASLEEKLGQAQASVAESDRKRQELLAEDEKLKAVAAELTQAVVAMESDVQRLYKSVPDPLQTKLQPLQQRIPTPATTELPAVAERFQNVLGILNELNKANTEITVNYEVRNLANGRPSEVKAMYVGLAQAYYVSNGGEAGIGRPTSDGWTWEPSKRVASDVLKALEILDGKHSPAFVPLPVKMQ